MTTTTPCILWKGALDGKGYGAVTINGKTIGIHRVAFYLFNAYMPNTCRHTCGTRRCINPDHLIDGTRGDNNRDTVLQGRNVNAAKTHCRYGHEYTEENTYRVPSDPSKRFCATCRRLRQRGGLANLEPIDNTPALGAPVPLDISPKRHCSKGHELNSTTEYFDKDGERFRCKSCQGIANRKSQHRRKMRGLGFTTEEIESWIAEQDWELAHPRQRLRLQLPERAE